MSWDVDEKEFYETFAEIAADPNRGFDGGMEWAWSALDWTQQELQKEAAKSQSILAEERAAVVAWLRAQRQYGTDALLGQGFANVCGILAGAIERGEHRRKENE
jgi:hypothetical protein